MFRRSGSKSRSIGSSPTSDAIGREYRMVKLRNKPFYDLRRSHARERWKNAHHMISAAGTTLSTEGQERRQGYLERRWNTITGPEELHAVTFSRESTRSNTDTLSESLSIEQSPDRERELLLRHSTSTPHGEKRTKSTEKNVSFDLEEDESASREVHEPGQRNDNARFYVQACRQRRFV